MANTRNVRLYVLAVHRPFHISICISTLPMQHTMLIYKKGLALTHCLQDHARRWAVKNSNGINGIYNTMSNFPGFTVFIIFQRDWLTPLKVNIQLFCWSWLACNNRSTLFNVVYFEYRYIYISIPYLTGQAPMLGEAPTPVFWLKVIFPAIFKHDGFDALSSQRSATLLANQNLIRTSK